MTPRVETIRTEGLGDSTYILIHLDIAMVVDPQRDIDRFQTVLEDADAELRLVLETHVHNDYVSGGRDLARRFDAEVVMPAGAAPVFRHRPAFHYEDIDVGVMVVRPIHTPGHTPEHTSYLILVDDRETAVFSGGSLLVGSAGRSDLLGVERAETLARLQYGSVNRLARLPDAVELFPTHGEGSFCTTSGAQSHTSTIGEEKTGNPVLAYEDEDAFVKGQLSGLVPYPSYYRHMGPINLLGLDPPELSAHHLEEIPDGVTVIDGRPMAEFAAGHVPGSIGIELRDSFGTWVGWLTEFNTPLVLVLDRDQDTEEAMRQLVRIGYDQIRGMVNEVPGELDAYPTQDLTRFLESVASGAQVLDVRAPDEWESGVIEGATLYYLPDLATGAAPDLDPRRPVFVACSTGVRASTAASLLQNLGYDPVALIGAGVTDVLAAQSNSP